MLYSVTGILVLSEPYHIVVECGGVGYSIKTSLTTAASLPQLGEKVKIYTYLSVREDALDLFGFYDKAELDAFRMLISVSGVGPKAAVSILSSLTPDRFALAVSAGDVKALKAPGIGPKTAQRIVLDLKDKVAEARSEAGASLGGEVSSVKTGNASEAVSALEVLGYSRSEAAAVIGKLDPELPVEEMIKHGLKALSGKL